MPAALPAWLTGVRGGLGLAWMFVIAAELMGASEGLGYLLLDGQMVGNAGADPGCAGPVRDPRQGHRRRLVVLLTRQLVALAGQLRAAG